MNEKLPWELSLNLTLTQHLRDEDRKLWELHPCFKIEPPRAWYYQISLNSCTLASLLQVDFTFGDEPKIVYNFFYETKDISIFSWFSIPDFGHYYKLRGPNHQLPPNKVDYLVCTIWPILNFLHLWTTTVAYPRTQHVFVVLPWTYP